LFKLTELGINKFVALSAQTVGFRVRCIDDPVGFFISAAYNLRLRDQTLLLSVAFRNCALIRLIALGNGALSFSPSTFHDAGGLVLRLPDGRGGAVVRVIDHGLGVSFCTGDGVIRL